MMSTERQPLVQQKSPASWPWRILGFAAAALAVSSVVVVQNLGPAKTPAPPLLAAPASGGKDSSDVVGCGCTIQWCCDKFSEGVLDHNFVSVESEDFIVFDTPCAMLSYPIVGLRQEFGVQGRDANSICAEVESGTRDGKSSVCDQPEMFETEFETDEGPKTFKQESVNMIIAEFGKSCSDGDSCELPGYETDTNGHLVGPMVEVGPSWSVGFRLYGYDERAGSNGTVTIGSCSWEACVAGNGRPVVVIPGTVPGVPGGDLCDGTYEPSAYVGPFDDENAYGVCVDFKDNVTDVGGRVIFTSMSGSDESNDGLNSELFKEDHPDCCVETPTSPPSPSKKKKKSDGAASTTAAVALVVSLLLAILAY